MDKLPYEELEKLITAARRAVPVGSKWQHYKGGKYTVVGHVIIEYTQGVGVIYRSLEHPTLSFLRPLTEWQEVIEWEGNKLRRFHQLDN